MKNLWNITISLFGQENTETCTQWGWKLEDGVLNINFQGSVSKRDWIQNFDFLRVPYKSMPKKFRVHRGFLTKWKSVQADVMRVVETSEFKTLIVTGFSQGGALASLCHEDLVFRGYVPVTYAFGSPRVFSWFTPRDRFENLFRVTLNWDPIPGLAPWSWGYRHVGRELHYGRKPRWFRIWPWDHMRFFTFDWRT